MQIILLGNTAEALTAAAATAVATAPAAVGGRFFITEKHVFLSSIKPSFTENKKIYITVLITFICILKEKYI